MLDILLTYTGGTDAFIPGLYRWDRRGRVPVPVRVWFGQPLDPLTGELLDRSWRWQFEFDGFTLDAFAKHLGATADDVLDNFWPKCRDSEIDPGEYQYLLDTAAHARENDPSSPFSRRGGKVDLLTASIPEI